MRLTDCWRDWERACDERSAQLKANEEELNRIFIDIIRYFQHFCFFFRKYAVQPFFRGTGLRH